MPEFGSIGGSMNTIGLTTGYNSVGSVTRTSLDGSAAAPAARTTPDSTIRPASSDRVELSDHARFMERLRSMPSVRVEKVAAIKAEIDAGTYDTDEKLAVALERMFDEVDPTET